MMRVMPPGSPATEATPTRYLPLATVLKAALVAGLAAGLTVAVFHLLVTEPVIERAIGLEAQLHGGDAAGDVPLVSRDAQRVGLVVGFLLPRIPWRPDTPVHGRVREEA